MDDVPRAARVQGLIKVELHVIPIPTLTRLLMIRTPTSIHQPIKHPGLQILHLNLMLPRILSLPTVALGLSPLDESAQSEDRFPGWRGCQLGLGLRLHVVN